MRTVTHRLFHAVENNGDAEFERNGESWLLRELTAKWRRDSIEPVVFDVGANVGRYTERVLLEMARAGLRATVHVFEPSAQCIGVLSHRFNARGNVHVHRAAVGERAGTLRLHAAFAGSTLASLIERSGFDDTAGEDVPVLRLDSVLDSQRIARVDFLKLDVEGSELGALQGLGHWLDPSRVTMIQFEYGGTTLDARTSLGEIAALLEARGYGIAKLFPRALELRRYASWMEHFTYANFVALDVSGIRSG